MATTVLNRSVSESATTLLPQMDHLEPILVSKGKRRMIIRMSTMDSSDSQSESDEEDSREAATEDKEDRGANIVLSRGPRRISIVDPKAAKLNNIIKEGSLLKQTRTFGRWVKRFCCIDSCKLLLRKSEVDKLVEEVLLKDATVVETSAQNINHGFMVITPHHTITLAANSRKELEEWMSAVKQATLKNGNNYLECFQHVDGQHSWFSCSHPRPTYCNVCGDALNGVAWHGLSCEVCKFKSHRRCVFNVTQKCKWTMKSDIDANDTNNTLTNLSIPHQWSEGNLPTGSRCVLCNRTCGSVKRLQDYRCLWCKHTVHTDCKGHVDKICPLGVNSSCVLPPSAVIRSNEILHGMWEPYKLSNCSPVLAFVNSKSGDNKGVRFLRRLKYWLNPLQVFDLAISGPEPGLQLFQRLDQFRVFVFGGDGSIGWVLSTIDRLHLHSKCIMGVVPLGTGNDLARVLGWGAQFSDEDKVPALLGEMECSRVQLLDRWSLGFTKDTNFNVTSLVKKCHSRAHSSSSFDGRLYTDSASPQNLITQQSQTCVNSVSDSSLSPEPFLNHLSPPPLQDSVSVNSSVSSCGYHTALSQSPSNGSLTERATDSEEKLETVIERTLTDSEEKPIVKCDNDSVGHVKMLDNHIVVVTPPQDSSLESLKWAGSLQELITSHLSTILLSANHEQVVLSSQVLCEVVKQFINSLQNQQLHKLSNSQFEEDPLMTKCSVLNEKLALLIKTLKEEMSSGNNNGETHRTEKKELKVFQPRQAIMSRANSLKKAVESILDTTEQALNSQEKVSTDSTTNTNVLSLEPNDTTLLLEPRLSRSERNSPLLTTESALELPSSQPPDFREMVCMNNYFGLGLDAKIAYEFNTRREENPSQYKNRAKNLLLYGYLGGREFFTNTQRHLERKLTLECDGKPIQLPQRLQGLVFLNIPSYMAGTNFWGTEKGKEKEGFNAPSMDDKLVEVVGVTGFSHLATTKVLGIQNQRLAQCRFARVIVHTEMPMQVDGEARMQEPGTITITHKNKARVLVKDKTFSQSLETWSMKSNQGSTKRDGASLPVTTLLLDALRIEEILSYQDVSVAVGQLIECIKLESEVNIDVSRDLMPHVTIAKMCLDRVFPSVTAVSETADLEHLQDMESSVKSLIQETLWFLNMDKILPDQENEMRSLVVSLELKVKKVILASHSTKTIAHRGHRAVSDSALVMQDTSKSSHRDRSAQTVETKIIANSRLAVSCIGKDVKVWDNEDVCYWLKAIQLEDYITAFQENNITGARLVNMKTADIQDLGLSESNHQMIFTQCVRLLKQPRD